MSHTAGEYDLVVVGASVAGVAAAQSFHAALPDASVLVVDADPRAPYDKPPLSKDFLRAGRDAPPPALVDPGFWFGRVRLVTGERASGVDAGVVRLASGRVRARTCVLATGCSARQLDFLRGADNVTALRDLDDALRLQGLLATARRAVIVGGGFIGLEVASVLADVGVGAHVVELRDSPLVDVLGSSVADWLRAVHESRGVRFHTGVGVVSAQRDADRRVTAVQLSTGELLPCDLVLVCVGVSPNTDWLGDGASAGVECDAYLRTSTAGTFAAGDVARYLDAFHGGHHRIEHWTTARTQGATAGRNAASTITGAALEPFVEVPYVWSDQCGAKIQVVGRPAAGRELLQGMSTVDAEGLVSEFHDDAGELVGAVAVNAGRELMRLRKRLRDRLVMPGRHEPKSRL